MDEGAGLVGRASELAACTARLASALAGEGRLVLVGGEPGIGKTRLAEEVAAVAATRGAPAAWGRAVEADGAPGFAPWRQVLRALPDVAGLAADLGVRDELAVLLPELAATAPPRGGDEERHRLFDDVARVLRAAAAASGLVVVLDDVHRADPASLHLLRHVVAALRGARLLLVATYVDTPAQQPAAESFGPVLVELLGEPVTGRVELTGLARDAVAALLGADVPAEQVARVHELTGGNPFFVGELARHLATGRPGGVPSTVRDAIALRTARLPARARHLLRAASVVGRRFPLAVVAATIGRPVLECLDPLDEAAAAGLVEPADAPGVHRFVHALVRDTIEAGLPSGERIRLHRAAVRAIGRYAGDRVEEFLPDLARHWAAVAEAGERREAASWIERAGDAAMRRLAFEEGVRLYRLALDSGGPELDRPVRHRLLVALADARHRCSDAEGSLRAGLEAAAVARELGRPELLADAALALGCVNDQRAERALATLVEEALAGLGEREPGRRARLHALRAEIGMYLEDVEAAVAASARALGVAAACGEPSALFAALRARQIACSGPDGVDERAGLARRLLALAPDLGAEADTARMWAHLWNVDVCVERGELAAAAVELDRLDGVAARAGGPTGRWHVLKVAALLAQAHGRFAEARRLADEAYAAVAGRHGAFGARQALLAVVDRHDGAGPIPPLDGGPDLPASGPGFRMFTVLGPAAALQAAGRCAEAGARYRSLGPPSAWRPAPFFRLATWAAGLALAIEQDARADVATLRDLLEPYRALHVGSGAGAAHYGGPVTLLLGSAAAHLGELDAAEADLRRALASCRANGAAGFAVEAQAELAGALLRRDRAGDHAEARALAAEGVAAAEGLGMRPFHDRLAALGASARTATAAVLTAREREVARCVARGMSNAQIARALVVSERTAQNHVQHILTKLGFSGRSQIAVWAVEHLPDVSTGRVVRRTPPATAPP